MKKFFPQSLRHRVIQNPIVQAAPAPAPGAAMTMVRVPAAMAGAENCVTALICRETVRDAVAHVYLGRTYAFTGAAPESFARLGTVRGFALTGQIVAGGPAPAMENRLPAGIQYPDLGSLTVKLAGVDRRMPDVSDFDALADTTLLFCGEEILSVARAAMLENGNYALTVLRGRFGTPKDSHGAGDAVWIAARARLKYFGHPFFAAGNVAKFKITVGKKPIASAIPFEVKL